MHTSSKSLGWVAIVTWVAVSTPMTLRIIETPALLTQGSVIVWGIAHLLFVVPFLPPILDRPSPRRDLTFSLLQVVAAIVAVVAFPFPARGMPVHTVLFSITSARFPLLNQTRLGLVVIGVQTAVLGFVYERYMSDIGSLMVMIGALMGFQLFSLAAARMAQREADARLELSRTLEELQMTRGLIAAGSRLTERMRIAREVHDSLGHHLTALSLNLELALHQPAEDSRASVETARSLCRLLLTELRDVLADIRTTDEADLTEGIERILSHIPEPKIEFVKHGSLGSIDPRIGHEVLRCVQEIATNTLRHARASHLRLELSRVGDKLVLRTADDGAGIGAESGTSTGTGLEGMRNRITDLGGRLELASGTEGRGLRIELTIPLNTISSGNGSAAEESNP